MDQHVDVITLGVEDLAASRAFYVDGLGWKPTLDVPGEVVFLQAGHGLLFSLFAADNLQADSTAPDFNRGAPPFSIAHNVQSDDEVRSVMATAEQAGATVVKAAQRAAFGGFHGYFTDPSGFLWEVCHNPGLKVREDGTVEIVEIEK